MIVIIHGIFGLLSLVSGLAVMLMQKGTLPHRRVGMVYFISMASLNVLSFFIYEMWGHWGPFHYMALVSLVTVSAGMVAIIYFRHRPKGLEWHYKMMYWSYVGLLMATGSHVMGPTVQAFRTWGLAGNSAPLLAMALLWGVPCLTGAILIRRYHRRVFTATSATHR